MARRSSLLMGRLRCWMYAPGMVYAVGEALFGMSGRRKAPGPRDLSDARRILVLRLDGIGDVVLTSPFLRQLRKATPRAKITLLVQPFVRNLMEQCPYVDEVLVFDPRAPRFCRPLWQHWRALNLAFHELLPRHFDLAIHPRWDTDRSHATFLAYFSGAPRRAGCSEAVRGLQGQQENKGWDRLLTDVLQDVGAKHEVEHNAAMLRFLGAVGGERTLEVWLSDADRSAAAAKWRYHGVRQDDVVVVLGLGAGERKRMWPLDRFLETAAWMQREYGAVILLAGGADESSIAEDFTRSISAKVVNAAGCTTLRETAALFERATLYIGNDTGAMHMAAAVGAKVVEISCHPQDGAAAHANSPVRFGPLGVPHRIVRPGLASFPCVESCQATEPHCILGVDVTAVKQAVQELLAEPSQPQESAQVADYQDFQRR